MLLSFKTLTTSIHSDIQLTDKKDDQMQKGDGK